MKAIINGRIITPDNILDDAVLLIDGERIAEIGYRVPHGAEIIDAGGLFVGPGFLDNHIHGSTFNDIMLDPEIVAAYHLRHGTTGLLAGVGYNSTKEEQLEAVRRAVRAIKANNPGSITGIHLEGPYTSPKYGYNSTATNAPDPKFLTDLIEAGEGYVKLMTFAPELEGNDETACIAKKYGVILAVGHSEATPEQVYKYLPYGLRSNTHFMCATGQLGKGGGIRTPGVDEAVMACDDIYAEVIPDNIGAHVRPLHLKLVVKAKGVDRVIIITDSCKAVGERTLSSPHDADETDYNLDVEGLAGSILTMDKACFNMARHTGLKMVDIFRMASLSPATLLGQQYDRGSLLPGRRADILILDGAYNISSVLLGGEFVGGN